MNKDDLLISGGDSDDEEGQSDGSVISDIEVVVPQSDDEEEEENNNEDEADEADDADEEEDEEEPSFEGGAGSDNIEFKQDDIDDEDDLDDDYLQKMDNKMRQNIVDTYHHELKIHNADEIEAACIVARNEDGNIVDPLHKTLPFITCYEKARVLGERAKQIEAGAKPFVELEENIIDSYLIALREYQAKKIPFIIQRPLPNGLSEYWYLRDLELLD